MDAIQFNPFIFCNMDFKTFTCMLLIYGFIGWAYESSIFSLAEQGKFMNRGCFVGPYCPIYGVVALATVYLLQGVTSPVRIVLLSSLVVCAIEYVTSWSLEKLFHARYWDYSYYPLNINGRISVVSGLFFGVALLFLKKLLHPFLFKLLAGVPDNVKYYAAIAAWGVFLTDAVFTTVAMLNLNRKCKEIYDVIDANVEKGFDKLNEKKKVFGRFKVVKQGKQLLVKAKGVNRRFVEAETRFLEAVPDFRSTSYGEIMEKMRHALSYKGKNAPVSILAEEDGSQSEDTESEEIVFDESEGASERETG